MRPGSSRRLTRPVRQRLPSWASDEDQATKIALHVAQLLAPPPTSSSQETPLGARRLLEALAASGPLVVIIEISVGGATLWRRSSTSPSRHRYAIMLVDRAPDELLREHPHWPSAS